MFYVSREFTLYTHTWFNLLPFCFSCVVAAELENAAIGGARARFGTLPFLAPGEKRIMKKRNIKTAPAAQYIQSAGAIEAAPHAH